jgi:hypothetical protein
VPAKIVARLIGHAKVDTTLNVYAQVLDNLVRAAVEKVDGELLRILQSPKGGSTLIRL